MFHPGDFVKNTLAPGWGSGEVIDQRGDKVVVVFEYHGETVLALSQAKLEVVRVRENFETDLIRKKFARKVKIAPRKFKKIICKDQGKRYLDDFELPPNTIRLISKRPLYLERRELCDNCHTVFEGMWQFNRSDCGTVYLCTGCKAELLAKLLRMRDALDHAYYGGGFETKR